MWWRMKSCLPRVPFPAQQCSFGWNGLGTGSMDSFYCSLWVLSFGIHQLSETQTSQTWPSAFCWVGGAGQKAFCTGLLKGAIKTNTQGRIFPIQSCSFSHHIQRVKFYKLCSRLILQSIAEFWLAILLPEGPAGACQTPTWQGYSELFCIKPMEVECESALWCPNELEDKPRFLLRATCSKWQRRAWRKETHRRESKKYNKDQPGWMSVTDRNLRSVSKKRKKKNFENNNV